MRKLLLASVVTSILAITLIGCATSGNQSLSQETEQSVKQKIVIGKTTKEGIKNMFGSPLSTDFTDSGFEIWRYQFNDVSGDAVNYIPIVSAFGQTYSGTQKMLTIMFNDNGTVRKYSMTTSPINTKTGVYAD